MGKKHKESAHKGNKAKKEHIAKWGGTTKPRKEEPTIDIELGFSMNYTWSVGRQVPRKKGAP